MNGDMFIVALKLEEKVNKQYTVAKYSTRKEAECTASK